MNFDSATANSTSPYLLLASLSAIFMGTIGAIAVYANLSSETVTFFRLFLGGIIMLVYLAVDKKLALLRCWPSWQVIINGAFLAGFIVFYIQAMSYTSMANAIMTIYLAPVVASITAHFLFSEKLNAQSVGLILFALLGFAMMMEFKVEFGSGSQDALGMLYAVLAMVCYSCFILINRSIPPHVHVFTRSWYQLMVGAVCMFPFMLAQNESIVLTQWTWLTIAGLIPGFLAILFAVIALRELPSATFGTLSYLEPIAVVSLAWMLFGQTLSPLQLAGCMVIMASGIMQAVAAQKPQSKPIEAN